MTAPSDRRQIRYHDSRVQVDPTRRAPAVSGTP
jgi:hypothetical protein